MERGRPAEGLPGGSHEKPSSEGSGAMCEGG